MRVVCKVRKNEEAFTEYTNMISDLKNKYAHSEG